MKIELLEKIKTQIKKYEKGCWIWEGYFKDHKRLSPQPIMQWHGNSVNVRAYLYALRFSVFPPKKLYRRCLNAKCVNPEHMSLIPSTMQEDFFSELPSDTECHQAGVDQDGPHGGFVLPKNTNESKGNRPKLPLDQFFDPEKDIDMTEKSIDIRAHEARTR